MEKNIKKIFQYDIVALILGTNDILVVIRVLLL